MLSGVILDTIGGYRLIRKVGHGPRADLYLAHPESDAGLGRPVVAKVYRPEVTERSVLIEAEALSRASGPHSLPLVDLAMGPTGVPALLLERLAGGTLARLLLNRTTLSPGEAITILAPLAGAIARLHSAGVAHGGLRLDAIAFDGTGSPALCAFGRASLFESHLPPVRLEAEEGVTDDLLAFERVAHAVLERLPTPHRLPAVVPSGWLASVAAHLFTLGDPEPVRFGPDERPAVVPLRTATENPVVSGVDGVAASRPRGGLPDWVDVAGLRERMAPLRMSLAAVRAPVWIAAGTVAATLLVAVAAIPGTTAGATAEQLTAESSPTSTIGIDSPVTGDDPLLALAVLLETRARCIRDLSVLCLDAVDQTNSAALAYDQQLVREVRDSVALSISIEPDPAGLTLEERLGDTALVGLGDVADGEPASILLMKGEAGWRIRDYLEW